MTKTVLITGATAGIGYELAKLFARDRYNLVLVSRSEKQLNEIAGSFSKEYGISVKSVPIDLSDTNAGERLYRRLFDEKITIDILVNNAGVGIYGLFSETDLEAEQAMMRLNMTTLTTLTKLFLTDMKRRREGKILNVASTAAFQPGPLMAVYYATKAFVLSFSEAIACELKGTGVTVTALCPGPTKSDFQARAHLEGVWLLRFMMSAERVAREGYDGLMRGKRIVVPGVLNKIQVFSLRLAPRFLVVEIAQRLQSKEK